MPVIQCPSCKRSLNLKQMPTAAKIKCPACSNAIPLAGARAQPAQAAAGGQRRARLTPEDEGFDFGQIQFPSAGPAAVSTFQTGDQPMSVYQGPIPGDPLGDEAGDQSSEPEEGGAAAQKKSKPKGTLSRKAMWTILGVTGFMLMVAIVIGTLIASGSGGAQSGDDAQATAAP